MKKKKHTKADAAQKSDGVVDRVVNEIMESSAFPLLASMIEEPLEKLSWTRNIEGYENAKLSAVNAIARLYAATDAAQAGFESETAVLDVFLYKVRAGLIQSDSPEIPRRLQYAQHINKADWFIKRLSTEFNNAKKRVPDAPQFNQFRTQIVVVWLRYGFWLMSDDLIARTATTIKLKPDGCNRQTITKAVKQLGLVKHQDTARAPIVKGLGKNGVLIFKDGSASAL
jgi:hypothetical protein